MADPLKKVRSGQALRIPAKSFNTFIDAARDFASKGVRQAADAVTGHHHSGIVLVRNDSGAARDRFDVLGISGVIVPPTEDAQNKKTSEFWDRPAFTAITPATTDHLGRFVILTEPLEAGAIGNGCAAGLCAVHVNIVTDEHSLADVADGDPTQLTSGIRGAASILFAEAGTGSKWAMVSIGSMGIVIPEGEYQYQHLTYDGSGGIYWDWTRLI